MDGEVKPASEVELEWCRTSTFGRQFGLPRGIFGWLAGHLMAYTNAPVNRLAVELLGVKPEDRVLEIGFGPGATIALLAGRAQRGFVAGIDPSSTMLHQATRRNRRAIQSGRVELRQGTASALPFADGAFDKVLAVHSFHLWAAPERDLQEVRRVLRDGGLLLLALGVAATNPKRLSAPGLTAEQVVRVKRYVEDASYRDVRVVERDVGRKVAAILANK